MTSQREMIRISRALDSLLGGDEGSIDALIRRLGCVRINKCTILFLILLKLKLILILLANPRFGLREIKREIRAIEDRLDEVVPAAGPLTTGPFLVRAGMANAVNVKVQNTGEVPIDVVVRLVNVGVCPVVEVASETITDLAGGCCTESVLFTAPAGNFEAVICPEPADAPIRAFVSVHSGAAVTSAIEYVFRAAEMLPEVCNLCNEEPQ